MWYVYILKCNDGTLYTGITNDLGKRVSSHNKGTGAKYTKTRLPVEIVYYEEANDRSEASKREHQIKKLSRLAKENLILSN
jgi:putative endonuclease